MEDVDKLLKYVHENEFRQIDPIICESFKPVMESTLNIVSGQPYSFDPAKWHQVEKDLAKLIESLHAKVRYEQAVVGKHFDKLRRLGEARDQEMRQGFDEQDLPRVGDKVTTLDLVQQC